MVYFQTVPFITQATIKQCHFQIKECLFFLKYKVKSGDLCSYVMNRFCTGVVEFYWE